MEKTHPAASLPPEQERSVCAMGNLAGSSVTPSLPFSLIVLDHLAGHLSLALVGEFFEPGNMAFSGENHFAF